MADSEAQRRVRAALEQRTQRDREYQSDWEAADKPTTVTGTGVVRQLGADPLDSRQVLSNTTAGAGVPIAGSAVPGGIVGDWVPRLEQLPVLRATRRNPDTVILLSITGPSATVQGEFFQDKSILILINGRIYIDLLAQAGPYEWRPTADPLLPALEEVGDATATRSTGSGTHDASASASATEGDIDVLITSRSLSDSYYHAPGFRGTIAASASTTATGDFLPPVSGGVILSQNLVSPVGGAYGATSIDGENDPTLKQGEFLFLGETLPSFFNEGQVRVYSYAQAQRFAPMIIPTAEASASLAISEMECVTYSDIDRAWVVIDKKGWIAWVKTYEYNNFTTSTYETAFYGPQYLTEYFYGFSGVWNTQRTQIYARRSYSDGTKQYASAKAPSDLEFSPTPIVLTDFRENTKSVGLYWLDDPLPTPENPCENLALSSSFSQYLNEKLFSISKTEIEELVSTGGVLDRFVASAVASEGSCDIGTTTVSTIPVKKYEGYEDLTEDQFIAAISAAWYRQ